MKLTEECVMCMRKACSSKKENIYKTAKRGLATTSISQKVSPCSGNTSGNEKIEWSVKKVIQTVFWDMEGSMKINFLEKGATVNSGFYSDFLLTIFTYFYWMALVQYDHMCQALNLKNLNEDTRITKSLI